MLDVRTPGEYAQLGHIPHAWLLPVDLIASAPAVLPGRSPVLVYCEHGVRSVAASRLLVAAGDRSRAQPGRGPRRVDRARANSVRAFCAVRRRG